MRRAISITLRNLDLLALLSAELQRRLRSVRASSPLHWKCSLLEANYSLPAQPLPAVSQELQPHRPLFLRLVLFLVGLQCHPQQLPCLRPPLALEQ